MTPSAISLSCADACSIILPQRTFPLEALTAYDAPHQDDAPHQLRLESRADHGLSLAALAFRFRERVFLVAVSACPGKGAALPQAVPPPNFLPTPARDVRSSASSKASSVMYSL